MPINSAVSIKPVTASHLEKLAEIYVASLAENPDEHWTTDKAHALLSDWLKRQPDLFFQAELHGTICGGFVVGVRPWWDGNHLVDGELFVDPGFQKQGVAGTLVKAVLIAAKEKYTPVTWETYTFQNEDFPLSWYRALGFSNIEEWVMIRADVDRVLQNLG